MSDGPLLELQGAMLAALKNDATVQSYLGTDPRIYDQVPREAAFPYVTIGDGQEIADLAECLNGSEIYADLHIWSRDVGWPEAKRITQACSAVLHNAALSLPTNRLLVLERYKTDPLRDPDGITRHIVLTFRALTEPA